MTDMNRYSRDHSRYSVDDLDSRLRAATAEIPELTVEHFEREPEPDSRPLPRFTRAPRPVARAAQLSEPHPYFDDLKFEDLKAEARRFDEIAEAEPEPYGANGYSGGPAAGNFARAGFTLEEVISAEPVAPVSPQGARFQSEAPEPASEPAAVDEEPVAARQHDSAEATSSTGSGEGSGSFHRLLGAVKSFLPVASKLLPILDGNLAGGVATLLSAALPAAPKAEPRPAGEALESELARGIAEIQLSHRELRSQLSEQAVQMRRVEDQIERIREATERNTFEQQDMIEDIRSHAGTLRILGVAALILLLGACGMEGYMLARLH